MSFFKSNRIAQSRASDHIRAYARDDAVEGRDYDVERLAWLWHVTTVADTRIINDNQKGVNSRRYSPGPYMNLEAKVAKSTAWYLDQLRDAVNRGVAHGRSEVA